MLLDLAELTNWLIVCGVWIECIVSFGIDHRVTPHRRQHALD